jgi:hypothetical protein
MLRTLVLVALMTTGMAWAEPVREDMEMEFVDSPDAIWVNRSVNDTVYWPGMSPNSVYIERDSRRAAAFQVGKLSHGVRIDDITIDQTPATTYQLNINGRVVPVESSR